MNQNRRRLELENLKLDIEKKKLDIIKIKGDIFREKWRFHLQYLAFLGGILYYLLHILGFKL